MCALITSLLETMKLLKNVELNFSCFTFLRFQKHKQLIFTHLLSFSIPTPSFLLKHFINELINLLKFLKSTFLHCSPMNMYCDWDTNYYAVVIVKDLKQSYSLEIATTGRGRRETEADF